jgi:hypothetical protein
MLTKSGIWEDLRVNGKTILLHNLGTGFRAHRENTKSTAHIIRILSPMCLFLYKLVRIALYKGLKRGQNNLSNGEGNWCGTRKVD